jgi:hypothetical protein
MENNNAYSTWQIVGIAAYLLRYQAAAEALATMHCLTVANACRPPEAGQTRLVSICAETAWDSMSNAEPHCTSAESNE